MNHQKINRMVGIAVLAALVVVLQLLSSVIKIGTVSITLEAPKTLCIRDTGIGIAPEDLPRIFEKGSTGYNGRRDKKSTGIGLYLCQDILTRLAHGITITSTLGEGTKVTLNLLRNFSL